MSKSKTVPHDICTCGKRAFAGDRLADKALGRARAKRIRGAKDRRATETLRGLTMEHRTYVCPESGLLHLTHQSRREYMAAFA